jgi:hypothetical protein
VRVPYQRVTLFNVVVPPYCVSREGRVFRVLRSSRMVAPDRVRFVLRVEPLRANASEAAIELSREVEASFVLDKVAHGQAVPTPEQTFEELWRQLTQDLDERLG